MASIHLPRVVVVVLALLATTQAARRINVQEQMKRFRRSDLGEPQNSRVVLGLTKGEDLEEANELPTAKGTKKVKFVETYDGIPIVGASAVLERDRTGQYVGEGMGHLVTNIDDDIQSSKAKVSSKEALEIAMRFHRHEPKVVRFDDSMDSKLEIILEDGTEEDRPNARLVYRISYMVQTDDDLERPFTLVDAINGDVVKSWNGLSLKTIRDDEKPSRVQGQFEIPGVGGNLKIGKANYGKEFPKLKVEGGCMLENNVAKVYACQGSRCSMKPFTFNCKQGFNDSINGAYSPMTDALFYISATYEMFDKWYGIQNPLQRRGSTETVCKARIHYGYKYENAFWDGRYITFGDGYKRFYPLTSINVVAHEISHGITEMNSGLIYSGESGGMNEAFSDMAGEAVEYYATQKEDWMVGYEIFKDPKGALRYFDEPEKDGKSIGDLKDYCPGIDVHYSSGLYNRAFYFLGETEGWNVKTAFTPFVRANQLYWTENSRFFEGACGVVKAAEDLNMNADDVRAAFRKVGVEPCVDTTRGLVATASMSGPVNHTLRVQVTISKNMTEVTQMVIKTKVYVPVDLQIRSPTCKHCLEKLRSYSSKTFDICNVVPGVYEVEITPTEKDQWKTAVSFFGPTVTIAENITMRGYRTERSFEFKMPDFVNKYELQAMMGMRTDYGYAVAYVRHNEKPDMKNYKFDYKLYRGSNTLICNPKAGTWYVLIRAYDYSVRGLAMEMQPILTGRRMDVIPTEAPPTTLPPPTTQGDEGSGSGSGGTYL